MSSTFGQRLENLLELSDLPASELGALASLSHATVGVLIAKDREKRGKRPPKELQPAAKTVLGLSRVLGCTFEYLAEGVGDAPGKEQVRAAVEAARAKQSHDSGEHPAVTPPKASGGE